MISEWLCTESSLGERGKVLALCLTGALGAADCGGPGVGHSTGRGGAVTGGGRCWMGFSAGAVGPEVPGLCEPVDWELGRPGLEGAF